MTWCDYCNHAVHNGHQNHPCCTLWARLRPDKFCTGCAVSAGHVLDLLARKKPRR